MFGHARFHVRGLHPARTFGLLRNMAHLFVCCELSPASAGSKDSLQTRPHNGFSLRCRDTSDRLLPPLPPETCTRALGSPPPNPTDLRRQGEAGGADASRRPSSLRPDGAPYDSGNFSFLDDDPIEPSDTPVARPLLRAALSGDLRGVRSSQDRVLRTPVKGHDVETIRGAFLR